MIKYKNNGIAFLVIFLLLVSLPLYAGDTDRIGSAAGVQVQVPVGARDIAMGGANLVYTQGVDAIYWNPAGLSHLEQSAAGVFSTMNYIADIRVNYLAVGANMGSLGHIGFSLKAFDFGDIPVTTVQDMDGESGQTFSPTFSTIGLTYANKLTNSIQIGVTGKVIYESIPRASATAFGFDIGLQYQNLAGIDGVSFGVAIKNIGTKLRYEGSGLLTRIVDAGSGRIEDVRRSASSDQLPTSFDIGVAYKYQVMDKSDLIVTGTFVNNNVQYDHINIGGEFMYDNLVALRAGYQMAPGEDADNLLYDFTVGAGLQYVTGGTVLAVDYAYKNTQFFDAANVFTLRVAF